MTGLIPQVFIDEILAKTDIIQFIDGYVPLKKQGTSYSACCPFHDEKTPSFNVIPKKQFYHCFGCGASGNIVSFVMDYLNQEFPDAIETLAARLGLEVPRDNKTQATKKSSMPLYEVLDKVAIFYQEMLEQSGTSAKAYIKNRGIGDTTRARYQVGYAPTGWNTLESVFKAHQKALITTGMLVQKEDNSTYDRYRNRIIFPIHSYNGRLIGFGGRAIEADQKPKYLNSPETIIFQKSRELYGLHQVLEAYRKMPDHILIVEGYMDVIALAEQGLDNAVATLGTATSIYHIQRLSRYTKNIVFCFDGDEAGEKAAFKALESTLPALNGELNARFVFLPKGEDPDSLIRKEGREAFNKRIESAKPLNQYLLEKMTASLDIQTLGGRSQLLKAVAPFIQKIPEGPYKELLLDELARITHLETERVKSTLEGKTSFTPPKRNTSTIKRTPIRLATALVLQNPTLYIDNLDKLPKPEAFTEKNQLLLKQLLNHLNQSPKSTTAQLIEAFRDSPFFDAINKLATWSHQVPEEALETEFIETLEFLTKQHELYEIEAFIKKARLNTLTDEERQKLQGLLQNKHKLSETE